MATKIITVPVSKLRLDKELWPRRQTELDSVLVTQYTEALLSGAHFPHLVAEEKTFRLIDGWHREAANRRAFGDDATVEVELRHYESDTEALKDAARLATVHGKRLNEIDKRWLAGVLSDAGESDPTDCRRLVDPSDQGCRAETAGRHSTPATVNFATTGMPGTSERVILKASTKHFGGKTMTPDQVRVHRWAPGTNYSFIVRQLLDAVRFDMINAEDPTVLMLLYTLHNELGPYLKTDAPIEEALTT